MEGLLRWESTPWGQRNVIGLSWSLLWVFLGAAVLFVVAHAIYKRWRPTPIAVPGQAYPHPGLTDPASEPQRAPERVMRHPLPARLFHWVMAASVLVLLGTSFFPIAGVPFPWVTVHWVAGVVLGLSIVFHVVHTTLWQDPRAIWFDRHDWQYLRVSLQRLAGRTHEPPPRSGKYPLPNKFFHLVATLAALAMVGTGVLMMRRVDTPFWPRNPYFLEGTAKAVVYVLHDLAALSFAALVIGHIYFALRQENLWITRSMVRGWITRQEYLVHHDPQRWSVGAPPRRATITRPSQPEGKEEECETVPYPAPPARPS